MSYIFQHFELKKHYCYCTKHGDELMCEYLYRLTDNEGRPTSEWKYACYGDDEQEAIKAVQDKIKEKSKFVHP